MYKYYCTNEYTLLRIQDEKGERREREREREREMYQILKHDVCFFGKQRSNKEVVGHEKYHSEARYTCTYM